LGFQLSRYTSYTVHHFIFFSKTIIFYCSSSSLLKDLLLEAPPTARHGRGGPGDRRQGRVQPSPGSGACLGRGGVARPCRPQIWVGEVVGGHVTPPRPTVIAAPQTCTTPWRRSLGPPQPCRAVDGRSQLRATSPSTEKKMNNTIGWFWKKIK